MFLRDYLGEKFMENNLKISDLFKKMHKNENCWVFGRGGGYKLGKLDF